MNKNKREISFDIARGIAIILVVMGHCDNFSGWSIERFSSLFFMQLFVFLSGIFFKHNEITSFKELVMVIKKKCLPIYFYYLKYELIFYILTNFFLNIGFYNFDLMYGGKVINPIHFDIEMLKNVLRIFLLMGREPFCGAFWFLITLIFIICEYSCIRFISNKIFKQQKSNKIFVNVCVLIMFILGCIMNATISIPRISPSFTLIIFYHLGNLYNDFKQQIKFDNFLLFLISIIGLNILYYFGTVSMNSNSFSNPIFLLICSFFGIYMVMFVSKILGKHPSIISKCIAYIGRNTLPIVALQFISFKAVMLVQYVLGNISYTDLGQLTGANNDNLIYILYVICGIFIPLALNWAFKKCAYVFRSGGKDL